MLKRSAVYNQKGFTLIEIAIVMVIIGLLAGGGVSLMGILSERKMRNEASQYQDDAKKALISFAKMNGRLPWADNNSDGTEDNNATVGFFPYQTLGFRPSDPYKRSLRYEFNSNLRTNRSASCSALRTGLSTSPLVVDSDGSTSAFYVAAVLISAGPKNADGAGPGNLAPFDAVTGGSYTGDNTDGIPNYIRFPPTNTFDDLVVYISGYELYSEICGDPVLTVVNTTGGNVYLYNNTQSSDIGMVPPGAISYTVVSGEQIRLCASAGGCVTPVSSTPATPIIISGSGVAINIP
jgi:prepilin-type N-terminal cleavage/methylation domain-containing protein